MKTEKEINKYLKEKGWNGTDLGYYNHYERKMWDTFDSDDKAFEWFKKRRNSMFESIKAEYQSR